MTKILVATEKPFAPAAVEGIKKILAEAGFETLLLESYKDPKDLVAAVADVDGLIIRSDKASAEVIEAGKNLKIIVRAGAGYDNIDLAAATGKGVVAMNTPGQNSNAVAELTFGMLVFMARANFKGGSGTELKGKKLGIHAYGNVGKNVARIAKGFEMEVFAFDPFVANEVLIKDGVSPVANIDELYSSCHYISLNIPATEKTKKSINFDLLSKMPKNATVINTARKEVIDEAGLIELLKTRSDFKYISDVMPDCHADLLQFAERYYCTPKKQGAETAEANVNAGLAAANQIVKFLKTGDRTFQVNK